jgi:tetratricopeptide (TPR) repeat protein
LQRARELAPRSAQILGDTVFWAYFSRNYDLAIQNGEAAIAIEPDNSFAQAFLGMAYAEKGLKANAIKHADLATHYDGGSLIASFSANVYALAGRRAQAAAAFRSLEQEGAEHYSCAYEIGARHILLGQVNLGFQWLDNAYRGRSMCMILLKVDPRLHSVRSDARYQKLWSASIWLTPHFRPPAGQNPDQKDLFLQAEPARPRVMFIAPPISASDLNRIPCKCDCRHSQAA